MPRPNARGRHAWNKGLTKETHPSVLSASKKLTGGRSGGGFASTPEKELLRRQRMSAALKGRKITWVCNLHGGVGIKGFYQGIWCDSSWELAWVLYHKNLSVDFTRNRRFFCYEFEGKQLRWYPDFKIQDGPLVEVKGYMTLKSLARFAAVQEPLEVFGKERMEPILSWVRTNYGKNFTALYEKQVF